MFWVDVTYNGAVNCFEHDTNYAGNDIGSGVNADAASPVECQRLCQLHGDECTVFTWASEGCYFKSSAEGRRAEAGDVSGPATCSPCVTPFTELAARDLAVSLGLNLGGGGHSFADRHATHGLYAYHTGEFAGMAFFGSGGTEAQMASLVALPKYRPSCVGQTPLFTTFQDRVYEIERSAVTFAQASAAARQRSLQTSGGRASAGHLVTLGSRGEEAAVGMLANGGSYWLGATDNRSEDTWLWHSGYEHEVGLGNRSARLDAAARRSGYENWAEGEPNDANRNEDCVKAVSREGLFSGRIGNWVDVPCGDSGMFVTEYEPTIRCTPEQTPAPAGAEDGGSASPTAPLDFACQCRDGALACNFDMLGSKWCYVDSVDACNDSRVARSGPWSEAACNELTVAPSMSPTVDWIHYAGMRYMFSSTPLPYAEAQSRCQSFADGATLVKIGSAEEQEFVTSVLLAGNTDFNAWIGCNDLVSHGSHVWFDGTACIPQSPLRVTAGGEHCSVSGNCATDGAGSHGNNEACTIRVTVAGTLTATEFNTESGYDYVVIGSRRYQGTAGPNGVGVGAGSTFTWRSDGSVTNSGWTICLTPSDDGVGDPPRIYSNWDTAEPSGGEEHCAHLWHDHSMNWNDAVCSRANGFICSTSTTASPVADPPTTPPTLSPTFSPTAIPTRASSPPTIAPTVSPTRAPTNRPIDSPSAAPNRSPAPMLPSVSPTTGPTSSPIVGPTFAPTVSPMLAPTTWPTDSPSTASAHAPSPMLPTAAPAGPSTPTPTTFPTKVPTASPATTPTLHPTAAPITSAEPTVEPTLVPAMNSANRPATPSTTLISVRSPSSTPSAIFPANMAGGNSDGDSDSSLTISVAVPVVVVVVMLFGASAVLARRRAQGKRRKGPQAPPPATANPTFSENYQNVPTSVAIAAVAELPGTRAVRLGRVPPPPPSGSPVSTTALPPPVAAWSPPALAAEPQLAQPPSAPQAEPAYTRATILKPGAIFATEAKPEQSPPAQSVGPVAAAAETAPAPPLADYTYEVPVAFNSRYEAAPTTPTTEVHYATMRPQEGASNANYDVHYDVILDPPGGYETIAPPPTHEYETPTILQADAKSKLYESPHCAGALNSAHAPSIPAPDYHGDAAANPSDLLIPPPRQFSESLPASLGQPDEAPPPVPMRRAQHASTSVSYYASHGAPPVPARSHSLYDKLSRSETTDAAEVKLTYGRLPEVLQRQHSDAPYHGLVLTPGLDQGAAVENDDTEC